MCVFYFELYVFYCYVVLHKVCLGNEKVENHCSWRDTEPRKFYFQLLFFFFLSFFFSSRWSSASFTRCSCRRKAKFSRVDMDREVDSVMETNRPIW